MYRHHPNTLRALLNDGRILRLTGFGVGFHALDESPERGGAALLETARQVDHAQTVGQRLLTGRPHRNARVRPDRFTLLRLIRRTRDDNGRPALLRPGGSMRPEVDTENTGKIAVMNSVCPKNNHLFLAIIFKGRGASPLDEGIMPCIAKI
jgi:hypothetical protein